MKYQVGDRVKCSKGYGVVQKLLKTNSKIPPVNFYNIELDKAVVNKRHPNQLKIRSLWYAEQELQFEKDVRYLDDYKDGTFKKRKREGEISL